MKNRLLLCLSLILVLAGSALAQTGGIRGKVVDATTGESLPNANILIKELGRGVSSDIDGNYMIANVPAGTYTIESSFVGYKRFSSRVTVGEGIVTFNISFESATLGLDELVVTGYGVQTKREVTGAIAQVKGEQIENLPVQTFDQALQGRAAGVQITSASGQPGGAMRVRIRGIGSINAATQPLYIVDGIQMSEDRSISSSSQASSNPLAGINPNDILSIEVLKDAAAASIYGSQAANGVVLITTKQGRSGGTVISVNSSIGWTSQPNKLDMLNGPEFLGVMIDAFEKTAQWTNADPVAARRTALRTYMPGCAAIQNAGGTCDPNDAPTYNWYDSIFQIGATRDTDVSISGGTDQTRFFLSGNLEDTDGQARKTYFKRVAFRANIDHRVNSRMNVESRVNLSNRRQWGAVADGNFVNGPFYQASRIPPTTPMFNEDGTFYEAANFYNILQWQEHDKRRNRVNQLQGSLALNYRLPANMILRVFGGIDYRQTRDTNQRSAALPTSRAQGGTMSEANREVYSINVNSTLNWNRMFENVHNVSAMAGVEYKEENNDFFTAAVAGFPNELFDVVSLAANPTGITGYRTGFKTASAFGQAKYDYDNRYMINGTLRLDGSSRFGADNRWGLFYAISGAWNLANESYLPLPEAISDLKLRVGYGITGNSGIGDFDSRSAFGNGGSYDGSGGLRPSRLGNNILTWEEAKNINLGLDWSLFEGRISGAFDLYRRRNERLLLNRQLPSDSGFSSIRENAGVVQNEGYEIELTSRNIDSGDFSWTTSFNITSNRNEVVELNEGQTSIGTSTFVGEPLNFYWGYRWAGVNPADGRPMWYDQNGNITYVVTADDAQIISYLDPTHFGGLTNTFNFKGLTLDVFFQYDFGGNTFEQQIGYFLKDPSSAGGFHRSIQDRWMTPGQMAQQEVAYTQRAMPGMSSRTTASEWYIESTSYIRLKNATLSYQVPDNLVNRIGLRTFKVFATGTNLITWSAYPNLDPEFLGTANAPYPQGRTIRTGVQVQF